MIGCQNIMLSQSDALRFEEVFSKHSGKEFSNRLAVEDIEEALLEMKVKISSEGIYIQPYSLIQISAYSFGLPELKGYLAEVDFEARDGLSIDQFITVSLLFSFCIHQSCQPSSKTGCSVSSKRERGCC